MGQHEDREDELRRSGDHDRLIEHLLERAETTEEPATRAAVLAEVARLYEHELGDAERAFTTLIASDCVCDAAIRVDLKRLAARTGRWPELIALFDASAADASGDEQRAELLLEAASAAWQIGEADTARRCCERALDAQPRSRGAIALLDRLVRERGDLGALLDLFDRRIGLAGEEERVPLMREAAACCVEAGRGDEAIRRYEEIRRQIPADLEALRALERLYASGHPHEHLGALEALAAALPEGRERTALHRRLAAGWETIGETKRAAEALEWVVAADGDDDAAFAALARLYTTDQRWCAAVDAISRHVEHVEPARRAPLLLQLAMIVEEHIEDHRRAIDHYEKANELAPGSESTLVALARLYELTGLHDRAAARLEAAARLARNPGTRTGRLARAGELYLARGDDPAAAAHAERLLGEALALSPGYPPAARALAERHLARGDRAAAAALLAGAVAHAADDDERADLLLAAGEVEEALGDHDQALAHYRRAVDADPTRRDAQVRLGELLYARGVHHEAWPILERVCEDEPDLDVRAARLTRLARALEAIGERGPAFSALQHAKSVAPTHFDVRCFEGELLFADGRWAAARRALERLLEDAAGRMGAHALADTHARIGVAAMSLSEPGEALRSFEHALRLEPEHRLALKHALHLYAELGRWLEALGAAERISAVEPDAQLRARYFHVAGRICDDELGQGEEALAYYRRAVDDDPALDQASRAIERLLEVRGDHAELVAHYTRRIQRLGPAGGADDAERLRLWAGLAETCDAMGDRDAARIALEVSTKIDGSQLDLRARFADACVRGGSDHLDRAIAEHHEIIARSKDRAASYRALAGLYLRTGRLDRARACAEAAGALVALGLDDGPPPLVPAAPREGRSGVAALRTLGAQDWALLRHPDEDPALAALWARVSPLVAGLEARPHRALGLRPRDAVHADDGRPFAVAARSAARLLGVALPALYVRREQTYALAFLNARTDDTLAPVLTVGTPLLGDRRAPDELLFPLAMTLASLRPERLLQLALPDPAALAYLIDAARALATEADGGAKAPASRTIDALRAQLTPLAFDQLVGIGRQLRERADDASTLAHRWLRAADLSAARAALAVTGDLAAALRALSTGEPSPFVDPRERLLELVWSSVTDALATVRAHLAAPAPDARPQARAEVRISAPAAA